VAGETLSSPKRIRAQRPQAFSNSRHLLGCHQRDAGRLPAALSWADRLVALDPQARTLRDEIARRAVGSHEPPTPHASSELPPQAATLGPAMLFPFSSVAMSTLLGQGLISSVSWRDLLMLSNRAMLDAR
jgi:hypothetical protein